MSKELIAKIPFLSVIFVAIGNLEYHNLEIHLTFDANYKELNATVGAVATACNLSRQSSGIKGKSLLDAIVGLARAQPDIDLDGDGPDHLTVNDAGNVFECISGKGEVVEGIGCPCDPRIADGYSQVFHWHLVPATITGIFH